MDPARLVAAPGRTTLQHASSNGCWELGQRRCGDGQQRSESSAKQTHRAHASGEGNRQARPESGRHGRGRERRGIRSRVAGHDSGCGLWCRLRRIDVRPSCGDAPEHAAGGTNRFRFLDRRGGARGNMKGGRGVVSSRLGINHALRRMVGVFADVITGWGGRSVVIAKPRPHEYKAKLFSSFFPHVFISE